MATVGSILDKAQSVLQDKTAVRWPEEELIEWVNDACREIALIKPDASSRNEIVPLVGGTKQTLPAAALRLLRVVRNVSDPVGGVGGRAIRLVSRELDDFGIINSVPHCGHCLGCMAGITLMNRTPPGRLAVSFRIPPASGDTTLPDYSASRDTVQHHLESTHGRNHRRLVRASRHPCSDLMKSRRSSNR